MGGRWQGGLSQNMLSRLPTIILFVCLFVELSKKKKKARHYAEHFIQMFESAPPAKAMSLSASTEKRKEPGKVR